MIYSVPTEDTKVMKGAATYTGHTPIHPWPSLASPFSSAKGIGTTLLTEYAEAQRENCLCSLPVNSRAESGPWTLVHIQILPACGDGLVAQSCPTLVTPWTLAC